MWICGFLGRRFISRVGCCVVFLREAGQGSFFGGGSAVENLRTSFSPDPASVGDVIRWHAG